MQFTERQKEILTGLGPILVLGLTFLAAEGTLRFANMKKYGQTETVEKSRRFYIDDETGLRRPVAGIRLGKVQINTHGFRGPEVEQHRQGESLRLAFLGSSTTYDANSSETENWPAQVHALLTQRMPHSCTVEYLNAGLPGYGTNQMRIYYEHDIAGFSPDIVVILPGDVTHDALNALRATGVHPKDLFKPSWLGSHSLLWEKLEKNIRVIQLQRSAFRTDPSPMFDHHDGAGKFRERLHKLLQSVEQSGAVAALVTITGQIRRDQDQGEQLKAANTALYYNPFMSIPQMLDARDTYNQVIREVAAEEGAILIEDGSAIPGDKTHFADSMHFTPVGSARMAERVVAQLMAARQFIQRSGKLGDNCQP